VSSTTPPKLRRREGAEGEERYDSAKTEGARLAGSTAVVLGALDCAGELPFLASMVSVRRLSLTAGTMLIAALGCLAVALVRNDNLDESFAGFEGAYLDRDTGPPTDSSDLSGHVLDPFVPGNAYLWLGAAFALAIAGLVLLLLARLGRA